MRLTDTILTYGKVLLKSRRPSPAGNAAAKEGKTLTVMGNGPSLRNVLDGDRKVLEGKELMSVNFAPNAPEFFELKPQYHILADPHFFRLPSKDANVERLWENLARADWPLTLLVPTGNRKFPEKIEKRINEGGITVKRFNMTPGEGYGKLVRPLFRAGLAMPRPRNVMIPAIMCGLREGYRRIELVGADHTWTQSLWVDDRNRVVSVQPHFYKDNEKELDRVAKEYEGYHLHDILNSLTIAFRSYFAVREYAETLGARIINRTPGSFIDAFERG